jgi:hypothetical protein
MCSVYVVSREISLHISIFWFGLWQYARKVDTNKSKIWCDDVHGEEIGNEISYGASNFQLDEATALKASILSMGSFSRASEVFCSDTTDLWKDTYWLGLNLSHKPQFVHYQPLLSM